MEAGHCFVFFSLFAKSILPSRRSKSAFIYLLLGKIFDFCQVCCFVSSPCMFLCLYVCLLALYRPQISTKLARITCLNYISVMLQLIRFWKVKFKGQGQGRQNFKNHILLNNSGTKHCRMLRLAALESLLKYLPVMSRLFLSMTSRFYVT